MTATRFLECSLVFAMGEESGMRMLNVDEQNVWKSCENGSKVRLSRKTHRQPTLFKYRGASVGRRLAQHHTTIFDSVGSRPSYFFATSRRKHKAAHATHATHATNTTNTTRKSSVVIVANN